MVKAKKPSKAGRKPGPQGTLLAPMPLRLSPVLHAHLKRLADQRAADTKNPRWSLPDEIRLQLENAIALPDYEDAVRPESQALGAIVGLLSDNVEKATGESWASANFARTVLIHAFGVFVTLQWKALPYANTVPAKAGEWLAGLPDGMFKEDASDYALSVARYIGGDLARFLHMQIEQEEKHLSKGEQGAHLRRIKRAISKSKDGDK